MHNFDSASLCTLLSEPRCSSLLPFVTKRRVKRNIFQIFFQKVGAGFLLRNQDVPGKIKAGHKRPTHIRQVSARVCGKLLRPAIWWFHITSLGSNVPRCSVTTKSFIRRFLGSFSCDNILSNNRSFFNIFGTNDSCNSWQPKVTSPKQFWRCCT